MHLAIHRVDIKRMASTGQGISKTMTALYTGVACTVIPMDNQSTVANGWDYGQGYEVFFAPAQDVKKGDKLVWNGLNLIVQGVKDFTGFALVAHRQVMAQREDS